MNTKKKSFIENINAVASISELNVTTGNEDMIIVAKELKEMLAKASGNGVVSTTGSQSIQGATGAQGIQGIQGEQGVQGEAGDVSINDIDAKITTSETTINTKIDALDLNVGFKVVQSLPTASLLYFEKAVYSIDNSAEYVCVADNVTPTEDSQCFWLQR